MKPNGVNFLAPPAGPLTSRGAVGGSTASLRSVADISGKYRHIGCADFRYTTLIIVYRYYIVRMEIEGYPTPPLLLCDVMFYVNSKLCGCWMCCWCCAVVLMAGAAGFV